MKFSLSLSVPMTFVLFSVLEKHQLFVICLQTEHGTDICSGSCLEGFGD